MILDSSVIVKDTLHLIDDDLYELVNDVKIGNYSFNEIVERIEEMRKKLFEKEGHICK